MRGMRKEDDMAIIFVRERRKVEEGERKPRYRVVAVAGRELKVKVEHIRKMELEILAEKAGAEIVYLPSDGEGKGGGKGRKE